MSGSDVFEVLARLTRKSLVVVDETIEGALRYSMLETVRDYARQKLAARGTAEIRALRDRHADFYASEVERRHPDPIGPPSHETPDRITAAFSWADDEYHNIQAVFAWWLDSNQVAPGIWLTRLLNRFWLARGFDAEAHRWLAPFVELAERTGRESSRTLPTTSGRRNVMTDADRAAAIASLGIFASRQGDYVGARGRLAESTEMWRAIGNDPMLAVTLATLGLTEWLVGDVAGAVEHLEESRRVLQRCERDPVAVGYAPVTLRHLGVVARYQGDYVRATEYFRESLVQARRAAVSSLTGPNIARALCHLARTVYLQGDLAQSKQLFGEALGIMRVERLAGHLLAECLEWLASVADAEGRPGDAAVAFGAADAQWQTSGGVRYAPERPAYEVELARVRGKLAPDEFAAASAEGRAMSREQAVDFGLLQTRLASPFQQNGSGRSASRIASSSVND